MYLSFFTFCIIAFIYLKEPHHVIHIMSCHVILSFPLKHVHVTLSTLHSEWKFLCLFFVVSHH